MKEYVIIHQDKFASNVTYCSFETATSNIDMLIKILWHLSQSVGVTDELESLSNWLKENNKPYSLKELCQFDAMNKNTDIVDYIKQRIDYFNNRSDLRIRQIIEKETHVFVYDTENIQYFGDYISGDCDYYNTINNMQ